MGGSTKGRKESCSWSWLNRRLSHLERPVYSPSIMALIFWSLLSNSIHPHTQRLMLSLIAHSSTFLSPSSGPGSASQKTYNWFLQSAHNPHLHSAYADVCIRQNTLRRRKQANQEIFRIANLPVTFFLTGSPLWLERSCASSSILFWTWIHRSTLSKKKRAVENIFHKNKRTRLVTR